MTRTGRAPKLASHIAAPFVTLHADDASAAGIREGELARVETRWGAVVARARIGTQEVTRGSVFVPIHWNDAFASAGRVGALVNPVVDAVSGEPEFKHTPARIMAWAAAWQGFLLTRRAPLLAGVDYWARAAGTQHRSYELAGLKLPSNWNAQLRSMLGACDGDWIEFEDRARGSYRAALLIQGRLEACLFASAASVTTLPSRQWLASLFAKEQLEAADRATLLAGRRAGGADAGPQVCACFSVCRNTIVEAIREGHLTSAQQIGRQLKAGTNCGSCLPELRSLLALTNAPATT
jgi:assimilatory nitrate reductase catalytic subunit